MHVLGPAEMLERLREERVRVPVVERHVGRRPQDDEHARRVDAEPLEQRAVGLEVREVVLLLQARVLDELRRAHAVRPQPLGGDRVRHDDPRRRAAAELVLQRRELVVERRRARDPEPPRGDRQLVRAVRERDVEVAASRPLPQRAEPVRHLPRLLQPRPAAVPPDHRVGLEAVQLEQLERLRVVARRDLDLVAAPAHDLDQRPEDEHVRRRGDVDPDLHAASASIRADSSRGGSCSTCRSYQSVKASSPHSWRLQSSRPATCSSISRVTGSGWKKPWRWRFSGDEHLAGERLELAAQPGRGRDREAALAAVHDLGRHQRLHRLAQQHLLREAAHLEPRRQREGEIRHERVEEGDARLERVRHRGAVGLHEQVVDEVDAEVDVLQPRELRRSRRLGVARAVDVDRVERGAAAGQLGARVGGEDLLPAVMPLERRQVRGAHEPLRLVVEARLARGRRAAPRRAGGRARASGARRSASRSATYV